MSIILYIIVSVISLFWIGPWSLVLLGGRVFLTVLLALAFGVALLTPIPWYLVAPPLVCALAGAWLTSAWRVRQGV